MEIESLEEEIILFMKYDYIYFGIIRMRLIDRLTDYLIHYRLKEDKEFLSIIKKYENENNKGRFPLEEF